MLAALLATFLLAPASLDAADNGPSTVSAKGSGSGGTDDDDDDRDRDNSGSGSSGSGNSGSGSTDDDDDDRDKDNSGSGSSGSGKSGSGSSGSGNSGSGSTDDDDDRDKDKSGSGSSGSGSSGSGSSGSGSSGSGGASTDDGDRSEERSTRQRFEGKTRALIDGFQAEFSVRREVRFDREKFRAEASNLNLGAGTRLAVCFNGASLGDITLNSLNFGELELDSRRGQAIPDFTGGETVDLRLGSCGGNLVLSATFGSTAGGGGQTTPPVNDRSRIEGKARRFINGFEAEFSVRLERRPDRDKFRAEAHSLNLGAGARLDVCFAGDFLGDIFLNSLNFGELELDSRLGHSFPIFENGQTVELRQGGCTGELLLAATFGGVSNNPNPGDPNEPQGGRTEIEGKTRRVLNDFEAEFSIRFEQRFDRDKIRAEVSNLNLNPGTILTVCFDGSSLGRVRLSPIHFAELELDSRLGHSVPILGLGDTLSIHEGGACSSTSQLLSATLGVGD